MKLTRHNGRSGKNGVYNPKHNDRNFKIENSEHIDPELAKIDFLWDCYQGFATTEMREREELSSRFEKVEQAFYSQRYFDYCDGQHERNFKRGHPERDRTTEDLRLSKKTCPEESIIQIGTKEEHVDPVVLLKIASDYFLEFEKRFGTNVHILDWALHLDEATPHIHERHVFDVVNQYGEVQPAQDKALEALGVTLPYPDKPKSKTNNRKVMFDFICRTMLFDICKEHGLNLDEEPSYGGRKYLEKQDYILMKQKQKLAEQETQIGQKQQEISKADAQIGEKERALKEMESQFSEKQQALVHTEAQLHEKRQALEDAESQISEDKKVIEETSSHIREKDRELKNVKSLLEEKKETLVRTQASVDMTRENLDQAARELSRQKKAVEANYDTMRKQRQQMQELDMQIGDAEAFIEEVTETAYNEAVRAVTAKAVEETHNMDFEIIEKHRESLLSQRAGFSPQTRNIALQVMDSLINRFSGVTHSITERIRALFSEPERKEEIKKEIRNPVRKSVLGRLRAKQDEAVARNQSRRTQAGKKHNMEL